MAELAYGETYAINRVEARHRLVQTYEETGSCSSVEHQQRARIPGLCPALAYFYNVLRPHFGAVSSDNYKTLLGILMLRRYRITQPLSFRQSGLDITIRDIHVARKAAWS